MRKISLIILLLLSSNVFSAAACKEDILSVILHKNGNVYFKSGTTCPDNWCQIQWNDEEDKDRAFSALLAARTAKNTITFYWPNIQSCNEENATYASPDYFYL